MASYDVGDAARVSTTLRNSSGTATDATVVLTVTNPAGTVTTPAVTHDGTGLYSATFLLTLPDTWTYAWTAAGTLDAFDGGQLSVYAPRTLVASVAEFKNQLRRTDIADDGMLRPYLEAATDFVEQRCGRVGVVPAYTERVTTRSRWIPLSFGPVISVASVKPVAGPSVLAAVPTTDWRLDDVRHAVELLWGYGPGRYEVVYSHGRAGIRPSLKIAGLIIAQHLWMVENGGAGGPFPGEDALTLLPGAAYAIPNRAATLLEANPGNILDAVGGLA